MKLSTVLEKEIRLYLFGPPRLEVAGKIVRPGRRKSLALLAYLAVTGYPHDRASLAALFWPESNRSSALAALRQSLSEIKKRVGTTLLQVDRQSVSLPATAPLWVDVAAFQHCLAQRLHQSDLPQLIEAADLYQADFMAGFVLPDTPAFDAWQLAQATRWQQEMLPVLDRIVSLLHAQQQIEKAISYAGRRVALDPWDETAQKQLLRLYLESGQTNTAVDHYQQFAARMDAELGSQPSFTLAALLAETRSPTSDEETETAVTPTDPPQTTAGSTTAAAVYPRLPRTLTPFVGRQQEITAVVERLQNLGCALLTILGPGGIGKTSLALAAARRAAPAFDHQVYFIPLDKAKDRTGLLAAIARVLGMPHETEANLEDEIKEQLPASPCLLILDNFEQLTVEAPLLIDLLQAAPELKLLVTSRCRLKLHEEWPFPLSGLAYPADPAAPDAATYEAVAFLTQAIGCHAPHCEITAVHLPHLVHICHLVEGLPLGLELAAAWVAQHSLPQIAAMIAQQPQQLTAVWHNKPERHSSLTAVCTYTWQLLTPAERQAAQFLTLFADGFDRAAAHALGVTEPLLNALIDKSLVQPQPGYEADSRWQMHQVIHRFIQDQIEAEAAPLDDAWQRYSHYYATFLQQREAHLQDRRQQTALAEIQTELTNIHTAWQQMVVRGVVKATAIAITPLYRFYRLKGMFRQGASDFGLALTHWQKVLPSSNGQAAIIEQLVARLHLRHGLLLTRLNELTEATTALQTGLSYLADSHWYERALGLSGLAQVAVRQERWQSAQQLYEESLALWQKVDAPSEMAQTLSGLAHVACERGDYQEALQLDQESLALYHQADNPLGMATALNNLSHIAEMAGDYEQAILWLQICLEVARQAAAHWLTAVALSNLAHLARLQGDYKGLEAYLADSLQVRQRHHLPGLQATAAALTAVTNEELHKYKETNN
jgi:DNA-binding SARP family transcriptional activator/predicted ATPase